MASPPSISRLRSASVGGSGEGGVPVAAGEHRRKLRVGGRPEAVIGIAVFDVFARHGVFLIEDTAVRIHAERHAEFIFVRILADKQVIVALFELIPHDAVAFASR